MCYWRRSCPPCWHLCCVCWNHLCLFGDIGWRRHLLGQCLRCGKKSGCFIYIPSTLDEKGQGGFSLQSEQLALPEDTHDVPTVVESNPHPNTMGGKCIKAHEFFGLMTKWMLLVSGTVPGTEDVYSNHKHGCPFNWECQQVQQGGDDRPPLFSQG